MCIYRNPGMQHHFTFGTLLLVYYQLSLNLNLLKGIVNQLKSAPSKPVGKTWCETRRFMRTTSHLHTLTANQRVQSDDVTMVTRPVDLLSEEELMMKESGITLLIELTES